MKPISIIKSPLVSEQYFSGVSLMADTLIDAGLEHALKSRQTKQLPHVNWASSRDPETHILNPSEVRDYSILIADEVEKDVGAGLFPVLLGGDCTILIGAALGMKRLGGAGLFFVDGHADFYQPGVSPSGETADMELGFVTGTGPDVLTNIEGQKPFVRESDTVLFGFRDEELIKKAGGQDVRATGIHCVSLEETRWFGFNNTLEKSLEYLNSKVNRFWIHLDFDVLSDTIMPAVDYRMPDGLNFGELVKALRQALHTGKVAGMSLAIFNPTLDWDGTLAEKIVEVMAASFQLPGPVTSPV